MQQTETIKLANPEIIKNRKYMLTVHFSLLRSGNIRIIIFEDDERISKRIRPIPTRITPYGGVERCITNLLQQLALCYVCNGTIFKISGDIPQLKQIIISHKTYIFGESSIVINLNRFSETVISRSENLI